jgi:hypothetical protein
MIPEFSRAFELAPTMALRSARERFNNFVATNFLHRSWGARLGSNAPKFCSRFSS